MIDERPGLNVDRLLSLMYAAINRCNLNLQDLIVLTEAATGAYVVTPLLAAMAGAKKVYAIAQESSYGAVSQIESQTSILAKKAGIYDRITIIDKKARDIISSVDLITNSGHVRPIDAEMISWMKPKAVVSLMYEAWEFRETDVDIDACRDKRIKVAGINERHQAIDVFSFLGLMAIKLLLDAGITPYGSRILLLCDNFFGGYIERGLISSGSLVNVCMNISEDNKANDYDAILVAMKPQIAPIMSYADVCLIRDQWPSAVVVQLWGDLDRKELAVLGVPFWPTVAPGKGHMGIIPSALGPEPVVRLQTGGLKVGEILLKQPFDLDYSSLDYVQMVC